MKQFKTQSLDGEITVQPLCTGVTFIFRTHRFTGLRSLLAFMFPLGATSQSSRRYAVDLKCELQTKIIASYQEAVKELAKTPTTADLIHELCSRGVKVSDISIQCQTDGCKEECATSSSILVELGEAAVEAAEIEGFCDKRLICMAHKAQEDEERHLEDLSEQQEARKTEVHEYSE